MWHVYGPAIVNTLKSGYTNGSFGFFGTTVLIHPWFKFKICYSESQRIMHHRLPQVGTCDSFIFAMGGSTTRGVLLLHISRFVDVHYPHRRISDWNRIISPDIPRTQDKLVRYLVYPHHRHIPWDQDSWLTPSTPSLVRCTRCGVSTPGEGTDGQMGGTWGWYNRQLAIHVSWCTMIIHDNPRHTIRITQVLVAQNCNLCF